MGIGGNWNSWKPTVKTSGGKGTPARAATSPKAAVATRNNSPKQTWLRPGQPKPAGWNEYSQFAHDANGNYIPGSYNQTDFNAFTQGIAGGLPPVGPGNPINTGGGGGGGGGYGGGGGGGGGSAMTQAMFDQMVAALGRQGPQLAATPLNLPAFQGQNIAAFNAAPYTQAQQSLNTAVAADRAAVNTNAQNTTNALRSNYTNDYANAQVTPGQTVAPVGAALQGTAGPTASNDPNQQAAAQANGANGDSQAAFGNLLKVLAANANQGQASRLNQVQMDRGTALNSVNAQNLGLGAGINQSRANAQNQWSQQDNDRRYQNSLMQQQWQREQAMQNNQMTNQTQQANWTQHNQQLASTLQPILDLIASGKGVNTASLTALLGRR